MTDKNQFPPEPPLYISRSDTTTLANMTGEWRFVRPVLEEKTAPCSHACPAGEDIPRIQFLFSEGRSREAFETLLQENPLPSICGRICFHPCQGACNRKAFDEAVGVQAIERFLGDAAIAKGWGHGADTAPATTLRVAVIGSGPAGLSAAWFLTELGHGCDLYEQEEAPGGVLRWGIPSYRLPVDVLDGEITRILDRGVTFHPGTRVDKPLLEELKKRYDAIFVASGHGNAITLKIPGEEYALSGLHYLRQNRCGSPMEVRKGTAAVIGGGNTAIDVARSLVRQGVAATIVYRRRREDMPALSHEIEAALAEGVSLVELAAPLSIEKEKDRCRLTLGAMTPVVDKEGGRASIVPTDEPGRTITVDTVFSAIGGFPDPLWEKERENAAGQINLEYCRLYLNPIPLVTGGDLTNSNLTATDAIASGKQAAMVIDTLSRGDGDPQERLAALRLDSNGVLSMTAYRLEGLGRRSRKIVDDKAVNTASFTHAPSAIPPAGNGGDHPQDFEEVTPAVDEAIARQESQRCFQCGICNHCGTCALFCPELAVSHKEQHSINLDYCKGCGICVTECPRNAMSLTEEST